MKKVLICLLGLPLLLSGCKDKEGEHASRETIVKGQVLDEGSKAKIPNAKIVFLEVTYEGLFGRSEKVLKTIETDNNGYYEFKIEPFNSDKSYECYAEKVDGYYWDLSGDDRKSIKEGTSNYFEHLLVSFAWFRVRLKNLQPYNHLDRITVSTPTETFQVQGYPDTMLIAKAAGNLQNRCSIFITKNSNQTHTNKSFYAVGFDTTDILIEY